MTEFINYNLSWKVIDLKFGLLYCVCCNMCGDFLIPGFIISGFFLIHLTVILARLRNIVNHTRDFIIKVLLSGLHCIV